MKKNIFYVIIIKILILKNKKMSEIKDENIEIKEEENVSNEFENIFNDLIKARKDYQEKLKNIF